ncbi:MAG: YybH family protein [Flavisolibacter sp.]
MQVKHFFLAGAIVLLASCNSQTTEADGEADSTSHASADTFDASAARSTIENNNRSFEDAFSKGDSTQLGSFYSSEAWLMPPNAETVKGPTDITAAWGAFMRMGAKNLKLNTDDVTGSSNLLTETGSYDIIGADNNSLDKGKYVVVWKKEGNEWKLYRDIWNSNQPPPAQ